MTENLTLDNAPIDSGGGALGTLIVLVIVLVLYFLPTAIARQRKTINAGAVLVVNLLLGWTFLGWVIALAMAAGGMTQEQLQARSAALPNAPAPVVSPDGKSWWNGQQWIPLPNQLPPESPPEIRS